VRTAFPSTGGFDEGVTLFCLHPSDTSSRIFERFLPEIAADRSVYAPDLPGCGESDPAPDLCFAHAAEAIADLAADLRLRTIDLLGFRFGAGVALELAAARPDLVRRLVLVAVPAGDRMPFITQESLVLRLNPKAGDDDPGGRSPPKARIVDLAGHAADLFDAAPQNLSKRIAAFLAAK
jgi:pimeloyl-ACP methyl ester carboxylesterase